jgi:hypothetical protein
MTAILTDTTPEASDPPTEPVATPAPSAPDFPHRCACGSGWSGSRTCHCGGAAGCHRTFTGESTFRRHRRNGVCLDPTEMGMTQRRAYSCWGTVEKETTDA